MELKSDNNASRMGRGIIIIFIIGLLIYSAYITIFKKADHGEAILNRATSYELIKDGGEINIYELKDAKFIKYVKEAEIKESDIIIKLYENENTIAESKIYFVGEDQVIIYNDEKYILSGGKLIK